VDVPETRYVRSGGYHIAYQTRGEGPPDLVLLLSWFTHVETPWEMPPAAEQSSTVKGLVAGSGIEFDDRGEHALKGVPGEWRLFAVRG